VPKSLDERSSFRHYNTHMTRRHTMKAAIFTIIALIALSSDVAMPPKDAALEVAATYSTTI
jgi:hypothetical protein